MRQETLIFAIMVLAAVVGGVYFFLFGPGGFSIAPQPTSSSIEITTQPSPVAVPFTKIVNGSKSTVATRANYLITSTAELKKLWKMIDATSTPPQVDFNKDAVIAVFAGKQPTTGYAISVAKIEDSTTRTVSLTIAKPGANCIEGQVVTAPYQVVVVPATALPLAHVDQVTTTSCQ